MMKSFRFVGQFKEKAWGVLHSMIGCVGVVAGKSVRCRSVSMDECGRVTMRFDEHSGMIKVQESPNSVLQFQIYAVKPFNQQLKWLARHSG